MKRVVVIGNGGFARSCLQLFLARPEEIVVDLVISDPEAQVMRGLLERFCAGHGLPHVETANVNEPRLLDRIRSGEPDYLFSIYNMRILKPALLATARIGTINFHNGPLPRYRGLNAYSWAIANGEKEHGVTWHLVDEGIDTGDILAQALFPIELTDTPNSLMTRGFRRGVELLATLLPALVAGTFAPRKQDESVATYYGKEDRPNGGRIDFRWPSDRIERFVRGLDFRPLPNRFVYPTASFRGRRFHPQSIVRSGTATSTGPGRVVAIDDTCLSIEVAGGVIGLSDLLDADHTPVTPRELQLRLRFEAGDHLDAE